MTREVLRRLVSFHLETSTGVPAYLQLADQVRQAIRTGALQVGDQLPTVKEVVSDVAVNPNTVMKAYWELEHEGLVEGRQGVGTFVLRRPDGPGPEVHARLAADFERWLTKARQEGMSDDAIRALVRSSLQSSGRLGVA